LGAEAAAAPQRRRRGGRAFVLALEARSISSVANGNTFSRPSGRLVSGGSQHDPIGVSIDGNLALTGCPEGALGVVYVAIADTVK